MGQNQDRSVIKRKKNLLKVASKVLHFRVIVHWPQISNFRKTKRMVQDLMPDVTFCLRTP